MTEPWHELTVTASYFHNLAGRPPSGPETWCDGHDNPDDPCTGAVDDYTDVEVEHELSHPGDCVDDRKPCGSCAGCETAGPDNCAHTAPWRCHTEYDLSEFWNMYEDLNEPGAYRIRAVLNGPDYWGEYDDELEIEKVAV